MDRVGFMIWKNKEAGWADAIQWKGSTPIQTNLQGCTRRGKRGEGGESEKVSFTTSFSLRPSKTSLSRHSALSGSCRRILDSYYGR
jgi:hypothetical protein